MIQYSPKEIIIIIGYKKKLLKQVIGESYKGIPIKYVFNKNYNLRGNMSSLWCARDLCDDDTIFTVSDLICNKKNIETFMNDKASSKILIDRNQKLFFDSDPVKVSIQNGYINRVLKNMDFNQINGIAIGIYMLSKSKMELLLKKIGKYFEEKDYDKSLYYAINDLVIENPIKPVFCDGSHWCDVDTPKELEMLNTTLENKNYY